MSIKVLEIIADASLSGGPRHILTLAQSLDKKQFNAIIVCPDGWLNTEAKLNNIETINYNHAKDLKKIIIDEKPNIVHAHGVRAGWQTYNALKNIDVKFIYSEHLYTNEYHLADPLREWLQKQGLKLVLNRADAVITPSKAVRNFLVKSLKIDDSKINIVPNGLKDYNIPNTNVKEKIGFIGGLNRQKGINTLISAMIIVSREFPKLVLEIIGDGEEKNKLLDLISNKNINVKLLGQKPFISEFLAAWKFLVIPSVSESFGQTALEAMIAKKSVIASCVGGLPEIVKNKENGLLFEAGNVKELAQKIKYLLKNPKIAKSMGETGRQMYEKYYTDKIMTSNIEKIYQKSRIMNLVTCSL